MKEIIKNFHNYVYLTNREKGMKFYMIKTQTNNNLENSSNLKKIFKGSIVAILISIILLFNFSAILTYTRVSENTMPIVVIIITAISILLGSQITTSSIKSKGILNGGLVGLIYIIFLYLASSIITKNFTCNYYAIIMGVVSIVAGGIGGIIGVNRRK